MRRLVRGRSREDLPITRKVLTYRLRLYPTLPKRCAAAFEKIQPAAMVNKSTELCANEQYATMPH